MRRQFYIGETVVVREEFLGTVTCITDRGIWVKPRVSKSPDTHKLYHHACYDPKNVKLYGGFD